MQIDLDNCILELQKPESERNIEKIVKYIRTLKGFVNILNDTNEDFNYYLNECAKILKYSQREKDEIIVQQGEKGDSFFLILKGSVSFLVSRPKLYELTKEEYLLHLFKLRKNHSNELLRQCLQLNSYTYPIDGSFDFFIKDIVFKKIKNEDILKNKELYTKAKELYDYIKSENSNKIIYKKSIEEYIEMNNIEIDINNTEYLYDNKEKERKKVNIPNYIVISKCGKGETFGELALEQNAGKRQATVITNEPTDFAIIYRNQYNNLLKNSVEKAKKKFFSVINNYNIFIQIPQFALDKKYYKLFTMKKFEKGINLIEQNKNLNILYFIINGEYEISTNRNIKEVNDLIIYYKKYIRKYGIKSDYKLYNPNEEERENDDLNLNKKFKSEEQNNILFERKYIKLTILQERDILGLNNLMIPIDNNNSKGLINCKTLVGKSEVYELDLNQFYFICQVEDGVKDFTIEYEINKMKMLIQRLQIHKKRIYNSIHKKEIERSDQAYKKQLFERSIHQRNRLHSLEANQILESDEIKNFMDKIEKEKEMKKRKLLMEDEKKKENNNISLYKKTNVNLPQINSPHASIKIFLNSPKKRSRNELVYDLYKDNLKQKNLYEGVFNSYAFTESNVNKKEKQKENKKDIHKLYKSMRGRNRKGFYDALILDRFNSCYQYALMTLNSE